jgi:hypothetical protein
MHGSIRGDVKRKHLSFRWKKNTSLTSSPFRRASLPVRNSYRGRRLYAKKNRTLGSGSANLEALALEALTSIGGANAYCRPSYRGRRDTPDLPGYSVMMRSAHSTRETKMAGLPNFAPH